MLDLSSLQSTEVEQPAQEETPSEPLDLSSFQAVEVEGKNLFNKAQDYINQYLPSSTQPKTDVPVEQSQQSLVQVPGGDYTDTHTTIGQDIVSGVKSVSNTLAKYDPIFDPNVPISEAIIKRVQNSMGRTIGMGAGIIKQPLGLVRFGSMISGQNTSYIDEAINSLDEQVDKLDRVAPGSAIAATIGSYIPQVAAGFYNGAAIIPQMLLQGVLGTIRASAEKNDVGELNNIVSALTTGATEAAVTGGVMSIIKLAQYGIAQHFMPEEIWSIINSKSKNFETLTHLAKYAKENNIRVSDLLFRDFGNDNLPSYINATNYWALRESFKGVNQFSIKTIDLLSGLLDKIGQGSKLDFSDFRNVNAFEQTIENEMVTLRSQYYELEKDAFGSVEGKIEKIPDQIKVSEVFKDFLKDSTSDSPLAAITVVKSIVNRFKKPFIDETNELGKLKTEYYDTLAEINAKTALAKSQAAGGDLIKSQLIFKEVQQLKNKLSANVAKANELKDPNYMTLQELRDTSKLISDKLYTPGGAISLQNANELRVLHSFKDLVDTLLEKNLNRIDPKLAEELNVAKNITKTRIGIFGPGNSGSEISNLFANALASKDMNKVFTMLTDSHYGVKHLTYIKSIMGKDSELFKQASRLYFENKLGVLKGTSAWLKNDRGFSVDLTDFNKAAASFSKLTDDDFDFIAHNFSKTTSNDLKSLSKLVTNYADIANGFKDAKYTPSPWMYIKDRDSLHRAVKLIGDSVPYATAKGARAAITNMPMLRTISGAGMGVISGIGEVEKQGLKDGDEWGTILGYTAAGSAAGYAAGTMLRHILEPNVDKAMRYLTKGNTRAAQAEIDKLAGLIDSVGNQEVKIKGRPRDGRTFRDYFPSFFSSESLWRSGR